MVNIDMNNTVLQNKIYNITAKKDGDHVIGGDCSLQFGNSYLLFPMSMITMLELACCLASSSQLVRWLKVSRLQAKANRIEIEEIKFASHKINLI